MVWMRKTNSGKNKNYSLARKLRSENKSNDQFEVMLNNLSLEEVIALKLELAAKVAGGFLYGIPIWKNMQLVVKDALLKYALSATSSKKEAARFLGLNFRNFTTIIKKFNSESYFENEKKDLTE